MTPGLAPEITLSSDVLLWLSFGLNALPIHPPIKVTWREPHARTTEFYEGNPTFLDETPNEPLGAAKVTSGAPNV